MNLFEFVVKSGDRYYIHSHKNPSKIIGRKDGYKSLSRAVYGLMVLTTHGGFVNYSSSKQSQIIRNYIKRHKLGGKK